MKDRKLTGHWAGFAFKSGRLVTPEGRELEPQDLAWLGLTATIAQEWRTMMAEASIERGAPWQAIVARRHRKNGKPAQVVYLRDELRLARAKREKMRALHGAAAKDCREDTGRPITPGQKRRQRG